jgi:cytochrome c biogenesis protein CcmG/thiol:disulfide interchange protein DsbE
MVGEKLPELPLEYLTGQPEVAGRPMIVEFWATWCPPCRASIPHLNEIYAKYKDSGLIIIGVTKEEKDVVTNFLKRVPMSYFPALDRNGSLNKQFKITAIPHDVLVDKTGKIVWEGHPMALKEKQINKVLK